MGKTDTSSKPRKRFGLIAKLWIAFGIFVAAIFLFFVLVYNGVIGYMPPVEELKNPQDRFASVIYSEDGQELGRYFRNTGNRVYADFDEISEHVVDALIATEDSRFLEHSGIDERAMARVLVKTLIMRNKNAGGGSTITQQLAKQLYSPSSSGLLSRAIQKPIEWMIALKLERYYSKDEIIKMYLNQFDFLYNAVGIKSAAHVYFGKDPKDLSIEEAATLVGMVKNPSYYNPIRQNERTRQRRNVVFEQMQKAGMLTQEEVDSLKQLPLTIKFNKVDHKEGLAPYFREELRRLLLAKKPERKNYQDEERYQADLAAWEDPENIYGWVEKNPKPDGSKWDIYNDGLKIYTTIDSRMQRYAEDAVVGHLSETLQPQFFREQRGNKYAPYSTNRAEISEIRINHLIRQAMKQTDRYYQMNRAGKTREEIEEAFNTPVEMKVFSYNGLIDTVMTPRDSMLYTKHFLRAGMMAMDPRTGYVKAYVGGPDFTHFQYDMVSTGRRQIGSTVKPFLYSLAMREGMTPCDQFSNTQPVITLDNGKTWMPRNAGHSRVGEMVDLRWALTNSNNWISARVMSELSPEELAQLMHDMGITSHLDPVVSLCLGPCDVSVMEMTSAYSAFANNDPAQVGFYSRPVMVTRICDANGNTISTFGSKSKEVLTRDAIYKILSILLNVVDSGTGHRLRGAPYNLTAQIGGKTGTTNYNADGWFMGFTPEIVVGTWVGGEDRFIHFGSMGYGQGSAMALPIFGRFMKKLYGDKSLGYSQSTRFQFPADVDLCGGGSFSFSTDGGEEIVSEESVDDIFN